ncbi:DUF2267 domain-containing protein [Actinoplanes sp. NPDC051859]|uniref:DUF2267 domain-containing protein n=1 Tax=Actinoplanes sp. NPDC051859 TaxID=3363909 RepID=UPI00378C50EB
MYRNDLVHQVRTRARLHGPNEARRVIAVVLDTCRQFVPDRTVEEIVAQLPADLAAVRLAADGDGPRHPAGDALRALLSRVAQRLNVTEPDAAFLSRVVFAQLNRHCRGVTPASLCPLLPAELRALFSARGDDPAPRLRTHFPAFGAAALGVEPEATRPRSLPALTIGRSEVSRPGRRVVSSRSGTDASPRSPESGTPAG